MTLSASTFGEEWRGVASQTTTEEVLPIKTPSRWLTVGGEEGLPISLMVPGEERKRSSDVRAPVERKWGLKHQWSLHSPLLGTWRERVEDRWGQQRWERLEVGFKDNEIHSVQSLSRVWLFATPWTAGHQASLSITNSQSLLKLMSIQSVMPSNHLILCCPLQYHWLQPISGFQSGSQGWVGPTSSLQDNLLPGSGCGDPWILPTSLVVMNPPEPGDRPSTFPSFSGRCCCYSVIKSCPTFYDPMDCSMPGFPVLHYLLEFDQTHVHWIGNAILSSHPPWPASPPAFTLSQY